MFRNRNRRISGSVLLLKDLKIVINSAIWKLIVFHNYLFSLFKWMIIAYKENEIVINKSFSIENL